MTEFRYLLDENLGLAVRAAVRRRLPDVVVWGVGDPGTPALGTLDPAILQWCQTHDFILVTQNRASMPVHLSDHLAAGHHVPGIFVLRPTMSIGDVAEELALITAVSSPGEYRDALHYLPLST